MEVLLEWFQFSAADRDMNAICENNLIGVSGFYMVKINEITLMR